MVPILGRISAAFSWRLYLCPPEAANRRVMSDTAGGLTIGEKLEISQSNHSLLLSQLTEVNKFIEEKKQKVAYHESEIAIHKEQLDAYQQQLVTDIATAESLSRRTALIARDVERLSKDLDLIGSVVKSVFL